MADTTYPEFNQYIPVTAAYLRQLLQPYHDALAAAQTLEELTEWVPLVLPESSEELNTVILQNGDVEFGKIIILQTLANVLVLPDNVTATPWSIAENMNEIAVRLFGPSSNTISVIVSTVSNSFQHELTEELTYGLLVGIEGNTEFLVSIAGVEITRGDLAFKHMISEDTPVYRYGAIIRGDTIFFNTPDFIQGVITSCEWIGLGPNTIITSLMEFEPDGSERFLNFN